MSRTEGLRLASLLAGVVLPAFALQYVTESERSDIGLTLTPFVWPQLLVAHLLLTLPLGWLLAQSLKQFPAIRQIKPIGWLLSAVGALVGTVLAAPPIAEAAIDAEAGVATMLLLRALFSLVLVLPWCLLAINEVESSVPGRQRWALVIGAMGLTLLPPGLYVDGLITSRIEQTRDLLERERLVRARQSVIILRELGAASPPKQPKWKAVHEKLSKQIAQFERTVLRPLPHQAPPDLRVERALFLIPLNRLTEAIELLEPLSDGRNLETLLLATCYQEQEDWQQSDTHFQNVFSATTSELRTNPNAKSLAQTAWEGLLFNARQTRRPNEVERLLRQALEIFPEQSAQWHFQLGQHHAFAGQPNRAITAFRLAAEQDPRQFQERSRKEIDHLRTATPACFLNSPSANPPRK